MSIQPIGDKLREEVNQILKNEWDCPPCASKGKLTDTTRLPGFVFVVDGMVKGVLTYNICGGECEIVTLNSLDENRGIGTALVNAAREAAEKHNCSRLWLVTTNDDIPAIKFYQKRGFGLAAAHINSMDISRKLKPSIPLTGMYGIPMKHELEFEISLNRAVAERPVTFEA